MFVYSCKVRFFSMLTGLLASLLLAAGAASTERAASDTVLVGGATGRQGQAVVAELQARGYPVRGLTRDAESPAAQALSAAGVEVVQGDYADPASLDAAMRGISNVFFYSGFSPDEYAEGMNVIAAAERAGVKHLVYSSGAAAEPGKGVPGAKTDIELAIIRSGIPYTVLRPVAFMENFAGQQQRIRRTGVTDSRAPGRMLHFIAIRDIGLLVAEAFSDPALWLNQSRNIAGDRMTVAEHVALFSRVLGTDVRYNRLPLETYLERMPAPLRPLFRWYEEVGYTADVAGLRARYPQLTRLEDYLRETGWGSPGAKQN